MKQLHLIGLVAGTAVLSSACGSPPISKELRTARDAYAVAEGGVAQELAPAELDQARQALNQAESAFRRNHKSDETRALSYIAERSAQLAAAYGAIEQKKREKKALEEKLEKLEKKHASMTQEELEAAKRALEQERANLDKASEQLNKTSQELEAERSLRQAAEKKLSAALTSLNEIGKIKEEARGVVITLSGAVLFTTGKYQLLPIAKEKLNEVATALKDQGYKEIVIEGHTDSRGSEVNNESLSLQRAQSVRTHLVSQGLDAQKISARGLGESRPVAPNDTPEGRANNRRVELIVAPE